MKGFSNPSAVVFNNGSVLLAARHDGASIYDPCSIWMFTAANFTGPYTPANDCASAHEDPMIWQDRRGFHMLTHVRGYSAAVPGVFPTWFNDTGGISSSLDGILWRGPDPRAYNTTVVWQAGGGVANTTLSARQRPFILFSEHGDVVETGDGASAGAGSGAGNGNVTSAYLYNGVGLPGVSHWDYSCTFVQQISMQAPAAPAAPAVAPTFTERRRESQLLQPAWPSPHCRSDEDCSLNGACSSAGTCACDKPWIGASCSRLGLGLMAAPAPGTRNNIFPSSNFSWGGAVLNVGGTFHAFITHWADGIGTNTSKIIKHGTSTNAAGPYSYSPRFSMPGMSPQVVVWKKPASNLGTAGALDAASVAALTARTGDATYNETGGDTATTTQYVMFTAAPPALWVASTPAGPFAPLSFKRPSFGGTPCGNAAPTLVGQSWYAVCQKTTEVFASTAPEGPWSKFGEIAPWQNVSGLKSQHVEDPFLWVDKRGNWHILNHAYNFSEVDHCASSTVSAHTFSRDGKVWQTLGLEPYGHTIAHDDGTSTTYSTLERPYLVSSAVTGELTHIVFAADSQTGDDGCGSHPKAASGPCSMPTKPCSCVLCKFFDASETIVVPLLQQ